jgi:hypothetical protein
MNQLFSNITILRMNQAIATLSPKAEYQEKEDESPEEEEELSLAVIPVQCRVTRKAAWAIG